MDAALDAVLIRARDRLPLTQETAAFFAEIAHREGRIDDALRLLDIAHIIAEERFEQASRIGDCLESLAANC